MIRGLIVCAILLSACGSSVDQSGPFETSIAADKAIADLSEEERATYCEEFVDYAAARFDADRAENCLQLALAFSELSTPETRLDSCETVYSACVQEGFGAFSCLIADSTCSSNLAAEVQCLNDRVSMAGPFIDQFRGKSCADFVNMDNIVPMEPPASCTSLYEACPELD